jgi:hypothetical protein
VSRVDLYPSELCTVIGAFVVTSSRNPSSQGAAFLFSKALLNLARLGRELFRLGIEGRGRLNVGMGSAESLNSHHITNPLDKAVIRSGAVVPVVEPLHG